MKYTLLFVLSFVVFVLLQLAMSGCTPYKVNAEEIRHCVPEYTLSTIIMSDVGDGLHNLNALAAIGWKVIDVGWLDKGQVLGFYTLYRCQ